MWTLWIKFGKCCLFVGRKDVRIDELLRDGCEPARHWCKCCLLLGHLGQLTFPSFSVLISKGDNIWNIELLWVLNGLHEIRHAKLFAQCLAHSKGSWKMLAIIKKKNKFYDWVHEFFTLKYETSGSHGIDFSSNLEPSFPQWPWWFQSRRMG